LDENLIKTEGNQNSIYLDENLVSKEIKKSKLEKIKVENNEKENIIDVNYLELDRLNVDRDQELENNQKRIIEEEKEKEKLKIVVKEFLSKSFIF